MQRFAGMTGLLVEKESSIILFFDLSGAIRRHYTHGGNRLKLKYVLKRIEKNWYTSYEMTNWYKNFKNI